MGHFTLRVMLLIVDIMSGLSSWFQSLSETAILHYPVQLHIIPVHTAIRVVNLWLYSFSFCLFLSFSIFFPVESKVDCIWSPPQCR